MKRTMSGILLGVVALAMTAQTAEARSSVAYICPKLDTQTGKLTVRVSSGCITGMAGFNKHDLELVVDQERAQILVTGGIDFHSPGSQIVTADCMGARSFELTASGVEARRYSVSFNGEYIGLRDMLEDPAPENCMSTPRRVRHHGIQHITRQNFKDWSENHVAGWQEWRGDSVFSLLSPLLAGHPETDEGRPVVDIKVEQRFWNNIWAVRDKPWKSEPFVAVWITRHGFLDDSVSGDRHFAELRMGEGGWRIEELFSQNMCARGEHAGQWTSETCV